MTFRRVESGVEFIWRFSRKIEGLGGKFGGWFDLSPHIVVALVVLLSLGAERNIPWRC